MHPVWGLSGRAFIPLLSSFACAIPGIMATRTIANWKDRLATIMVAPLMTCSARLSVYALLIGAFVPERQVAGLQAGQRTEVDYLNGAVVKLAQSQRLNAPANERMVTLMRGAEAGTQPALSGEALWLALTE